ncbi:MAG: sugar-transfer associated ATP-grasp domain-containing protein [Eubacteriales bacterium]|nr:sugar-transfer associated ATP-grasp domain-containing protein [Eubacteriales bacterium]
MENFGASVSEIRRLDSEDKSDTAFYMDMLRDRGRKYEENRMLCMIADECKKSGETVFEELALLNSLESDFPVTLELYYKYGGYALDVRNSTEACRKWLSMLDRYLVLRDSVIQKYENDLLPYADFKDEMNDARSMLSKMISKLRRKELYTAINIVCPGLTDGNPAFDQVTTDMELCSGLLGFVPEEYAAYHFWEKTDEEKTEFVSDRFRIKIANFFNTASGAEFLDNKYLTYKAMTPLYGRKLFQMDAAGGYPAFLQAFRENTALVKKNNFQSLGRGVELIDASSQADLQRVYEEIIRDGKFFILEEYIKQHPSFRTLNKDSVNTARIITLLDGDTPIALDSFLRVGRKGAFIDNGSQGGIFVHVDPGTGITDSCGIDEKGIQYQSNPDNHYDFKGIQLPFWDEALETAGKAARAIEGVYYAGWDMACTEDGRWIIVEGNPRTMYYGQQGPLGTGKRRHMLTAIRQMQGAGYNRYGS